MTEPVAIVHDWLTSMRGGERVVEALYGVFPHADLFTLTWDPAHLSPALARQRATTSAIHSVAHAPFMSGRFRALLPFFPRAVESFKLDKYSLVVSSSHCVAIGALAPPSALHVAYVHSTMRYAREGQETYEASVPGGRVGRALFRGTARYLRRWEAEAAHRPHILIANSSYTRDRIRRYYQRDAEVIEPPIETSRFARAASHAPSADPDAPFLVVSALVPNKRVDLALRAFAGRPERLIVVGDGPERARLERLVTPNVTLMPRVPESELASLFGRCRALLHPGVDDFGMVMVEALAAGTPVLACAEGGALDIVQDGVTGLLIDAPTVDAVQRALDRFKTRGVPFDSAVLRASAQRFDRAHFERRFAAAVEEGRRKRAEAAPKPTSAHGGSLARSPRRRVAVTVPTRARGEPALTPHLEPRSEGASDGGRLFASPLKRAFDVAMASAGLLATAPMIAAMSAAIVVTSDGPALFYQPRVGLGQRVFTLVKLRTMDEGGRVTRVGRFLRPLGLDELPQLWNVLTGDMSVIGPRPEVPVRVERYRRDLAQYEDRHRVRPGITGLAQIEGLRGDNTGTIADRLRYDLAYANSWTLAMDLRILLLTVPRVISDTVRELRP
jgi:lipopolysaccharide/colanic/teichoic acid biosynthesis glycosyltransferase/glycosyltransferase involved in cell wall biosynthesis